MAEPMSAFDIGFGIVALVLVYKLTNLKKEIDKKVDDFKSAVNGAGTLIPGTEGYRNVNTAPNVPTPGIPVGYDWRTGEVNGNPKGNVTPSLSTYDQAMQDFGTSNIYGAPETGMSAGDAGGYDPAIVD